MKTSFFKIFFSKRSEEQWLNAMGEKGYALTEIKDSQYSFTLSDKDKYTYSIQYLDCSPKSEDAVNYFKSLEKDHIKPLVSSGNWVYFAKSNGTITPSSEVYRKNAVPYFWRALYLLFFAVCGAIVCGYQAFSIGYLERIGHTGKGMIEKTYEISQKGGFYNKLLNVVKHIGNALFKTLNEYFKLWTSIFGESDAIAVISIVAPITIVLLILGALNLERYFTYRSLRKKTMIQESSPLEETGGDIDAEQNI